MTENKYTACPEEKEAMGYYHVFGTCKDIRDAEIDD